METVHSGPRSLTTRHALLAAIVQRGVRAICIESRVGPTERRRDELHWRVGAAVALCGRTRSGRTRSGRTAAAAAGSPELPAPGSFV
jgi:hypothetical protein